MSIDFYTSVIIQEFNNLFDVKYSDEMYPEMVYYSSLATVIRNSGLTLRTTDDSFSLKHKNGFVIEMSMNDFNSTWVNAYAVDTVGEAYQLFPVGFSRRHPKSYQGALARYSPMFSAEIKDRDITPQQADRSAVDMFLSDTVVKVEDSRVDDQQAIVDYTLEGHPGKGLFVVDVRAVEAFSMSDFITSGGFVDLDPNSDTEGEDEADEGIAPTASKNPFYYVVKMERKGKQVKEVPMAWRRKIIEDGLSWEFADGKLFVSNTIGAKYGFPPAPRHIVGLRPLDLVDMSEWDAPDSPGEARAEGPEPVQARVIAERPALDENAPAWMFMVEDFMKRPCATTFEILRVAPEVKEAYMRYKDDRSYKMGSNGKPIAGKVRNMLTGPGNSRTWQEYAEMLSDAAGMKNDTIGIMILVVKMCNFIHERDGKVIAIPQ